jgi:uncharacterized membrane protein
MADITKTIVVDRPVREVYNQWTQFEEFPRFMEGVTSVEQLSDTELRWDAEIGGVHRTWDATIVRQEPDHVVAWAATDGAANAGTVSFEPVDPGRTLVELRMEFEPNGLVESVGDLLGFIDRRAQGDLERFRAFIEERANPTGGWRGTVHGGEVEPS